MVVVRWVIFTCGVVESLFLLSSFNEEENHRALSLPKKMIQKTIFNALPTVSEDPTFTIFRPTPGDNINDDLWTGLFGRRCVTPSKIDYPIFSSPENGEEDSSYQVNEDWLKQYYALLTRLSKKNNLAQLMSICKWPIFPKEIRFALAHYLLYFYMPVEMILPHFKDYPSEQMWSPLGPWNDKTHWKFGPGSGVIGGNFLIFQRENQLCCLNLVTESLALYSTSSAAIKRLFFDQTGKWVVILYETGDYDLFSPYSGKSFALKLDKKDFSCAEMCPNQSAIMMFNEKDLLVYNMCNQTEQSFSFDKCIKYAFWAPDQKHIYLFSEEECTYIDSVTKKAKTFQFLCYKKPSIVKAFLFQGKTVYAINYKETDVPKSTIVVSEIYQKNEKTFIFEAHPYYFDHPVKEIVPLPFFNRLFVIFSTSNFQGEGCFFSCDPCKGVLKEMTLKDSSVTIPTVIGWLKTAFAAGYGPGDESYSIASIDKKFKNNILIRMGAGGIFIEKAPFSAGHFLDVGIVSAGNGKNKFYGVGVDHISRIQRDMIPVTPQAYYKRNTDQFNSTRFSAFNVS